MDHIKNFTASVQPFGQKISERFGTLVRPLKANKGRTSKRASVSVMPTISLSFQKSTSSWSSEWML